MITRGIRNNNPFNIKRSLNSWKGKIAFAKSSDTVFEQFETMRFGVRAGMRLLRSYIAKGFDTPEKIIRRFAPSSENNVDAYLEFVIEDSPLNSDTRISVNSLTFYWLCQKICSYESHFDLDYNMYCDILKNDLPD